MKKWTKDEIKNAITRFYKDNNRTPKTAEFRSENNLPSWAHTINIMRTNSIVDVLKYCDLEWEKQIIHNKISEEELRQVMIDNFNDFGGVPTKLYMKTKSKISETPYHKRFNGIKKACEYYGLIPKQIYYTKEDRVENSIKEITKLSEKLGHATTVDEYDNMRDKKSTVTRRILEKNTGMSFGEIIHKHTKFEPMQIKNKEIYPTKEEVKRDILEIIEKIGHAPFSSEFRKRSFTGLRYSTSVIYSIFETESMLDVYDELGIDYGERSKSISKTDKELLNEFKIMYDNLGEIPYIKSFGNYISVASTYKNRFGSIKNVCKLLSIPYSKKHSGAGKIRYDKNHQLCKSLPELEITNFLIDNDIAYTKENSYSELFLDDSRRFDWKININDKIYYIEYFGLYNPNRNKSIIKAYNIKTKKKIKDLYKNGNIEECLFLFPYDYNNKTYKEKILKLYEKEK